jgi:hypothetical protein
MIIVQILCFLLAAFSAWSAWAAKETAHFERRDGILTAIFFLAIAVAPHFFVDWGLANIEAYKK